MPAKKRGKANAARDVAIRTGASAAGAGAGALLGGPFGAPLGGVLGPAISPVLEDFANRFLSAQEKERVTLAAEDAKSGFRTVIRQC